MTPQARCSNPGEAAPDTLVPQGGVGAVRNDAVKKPAVVRLWFHVGVNVSVRVLVCEKKLLFTVSWQNGSGALLFGLVGAATSQGAPIAVRVAMICADSQVTPHTDSG